MSAAITGRSAAPEAAGAGDALRIALFGPGPASAGRAAPRPRTMTCIITARTAAG